MASGLPLEPLPASRWDSRKAQHLLNRAGFGVPAERVEQFRKLGPEGAVAWLVDYDAIPDPFAAPDFLVPGSRYAELRELRGQVSEEERRRRQTEFNQDQRAAVQRLKGWWLERMHTTERPLQEKMALYWHGHFATSAQKVLSSGQTYDLNRVFREHATANVKQLTIAVGQHPVMLRYLDNNRNVKGDPNENWARELMELFTMGAGNYTERDIKESARAFTGWTANNGRFVFAERRHDDGTKTFMGRTGNFDGWDIIDIIFEQPATARYFARELWRHFAYDDPGEETVVHLAATLRANGFNLKPVLRQMFLAEEFYSYKAMGTQIKSPVELLVRIADDLDLDPVPYHAMARAAAGLGQDLFYPPNVKGWDGGRTWINANTLLTRYNLPKQMLLASADTENMGDDGMMMMAPGQGGRRRQARGVMREYVEELPRQERRRIRNRLNEAETGRDRRAIIQNILQNRPVAGIWDPREVFESLRFTNAGECVRRLSEQYLSVPLSRDQQLLIAQALGADSLDEPLAPDRISSGQMLSALHLLLSTAEYQLC